MRKLFLFVFAAFTLASCGQGEAGGGALAVQEPCAIIFRPAGEKLQMLKSAFGDKRFADIYQFNSTTLTSDSAFLASKGIKIISTSATQLQFIKKNGESLYINLNRDKYAWEVFLFNGKDDPVKAELADIETGFNEAGFK
jgi:hypothetical protein